MPSPRPIIVWFRDDLRLSDHPALHAAVRSGAPVICLYVLDETAVRPLGGAARWWLAQSLKALQASLRSIGGTLVLRRGPAAKIVTELMQERRAGSVFWNEIAQAPHQAIADDIAARLTDMGVVARSFPGDLLACPSDIRNKEGRGLNVFTPFWRRIQALGDPPAPRPAPGSLRPIDGLASEPLESWRLEPRHPDWAGGLRKTWTPGEAAAQERLRRFLTGGVKAMQATGTGPIAWARPGSRRICALARSARARSGTPRVSPRRSTRCWRSISTNS
jgi:deoxyribodipyrimidine photo-lyase